MSIKIKAELVTGRDLVPGDLFSTAGPEYWDRAVDKLSIGECVYIRTNNSAHIAGDADEPIYRITIERDARESNTRYAAGYLDGLRDGEATYGKKDH